MVDRRLQAGDSVLVLGAGGASIFALQMTNSMGARVISTGGRQQAWCVPLEPWAWCPVIDSTCPLAQLALAFAHQQSGRHIGKIY